MINQEAFLTTVKYDGFNYEQETREIIVSEDSKLISI